MWWKRYEPLLERKPVTTTEALRDLITQELVEVCERFPPAEAEVDWQDARMEQRYKGRLQDLPRVDAALLELLSRIVVLDLSHETAELDHLFRNDLHRAACPTAAHVEALHFLWRTLVEVSLARKEEAGDHIKRADIISAAARMPARWRRNRAHDQ